MKRNRASECERDSKRWICTATRRDVRQRLVHLNCICRSYRGFSVLKRIPGEADTRLKVLIVLLVEIIDVSTNTEQRNSLRIKNDKAVVAFSGGNIPVVTQAKLKH